MTAGMSAEPPGTEQDCEPAKAAHFQAAIGTGRVLWKLTSGTDERDGFVRLLHGRAAGSKSGED